MTLQSNAGGKDVSSMCIVAQLFRWRRRTQPVGQGQDRRQREQSTLDRNIKLTFVVQACERTIVTTQLKEDFTKACLNDFAHLATNSF
jgi:hypothetical protein